MSLARLVFKLQLTSQPDGGHFGFEQYGGPVWISSWPPSKIQTVCHWRPLGQIWCFWRNLNQNIPYTPDYKQFKKIRNLLYITYTINMNLIFLVNISMNKFRIAITKFRLSSHNLAIEQGRHDGTPVL